VEVISARWMVSDKWHLYRTEMFLSNKNININVKHMSEEATIGRRFSLVIPKRVRKKLKLREGQRALVREEEGKIVIEPLPNDPYEVLSETLGDFRYSEEKYEKKAVEWLKKVAGSRH